MKIPLYQIRKSYSNCSTSSGASGKTFVSYSNWRKEASASESLRGTDKRTFSRSQHTSFWGLCGESSRSQHSGSMKNI